MFDCCDGVVAFGKARQEGGVGFVALVDVVDFFFLVGFADDWCVAVGGGNGFDDFFQAGFVPAFSFASEKRSDVSADWAVMCRVSGAPLQLTSVIL